MPSGPICPGDAELLAVAAGDEPPPDLRAHLADCSRCRERLDRFGAEVALLQSRLPEAPRVPSTANEPASEPATGHGHEDDSDATAPWPATDPSETETSGPEIDVGFPCEPGATREASFPAAIGKYLVVGRFPRTGQAEVYRVVHPGLGRDLVLKLARHPVELGGRSEIIEEGRALASLEHRHLVRVYDQDFLDDRPYLVMEFIRGRTLDQLAEDAGLSPRRAAALVAKVAGAVGYAHRHGIVHRDIKPTNILVDETGEPRLIDFGMARLRHAWSDDPGRPGGTFAFMAPEQARIDSPAEQAKVGPRSDVFALGAVLYWLLTRRAPFPGQDWRESMDRAGRCDFDLAALNRRRIPRRLRRIGLKAMAADPADRYPSAESLQKALRRYLVLPKVLAVLGVVCAVTLLGRLVGVPARPEPDSLPSAGPTVVIQDTIEASTKVVHRGPRSQSPTVVIEHTSPAPGSLAGELTVRVWSPGPGGKRGLRVEEPGALPVRLGEQVHLKVELNRPAYLYLVWLDGQGRVEPLYPWSRDFGARPATESPRDRLDSPPELDKGWPLQGPSGLETALMLARGTPLPASIDVAALLGTLPPSPLRNPQEVAIRGFDPGGPTRALERGEHRGLAKEAEEIDEPLLRLMERLRPHFELIRAVRFAYQGPSSR
jgi:predicted Ser/Thr protein kinase